MSAAGMVVPKKGGCVPDFVSYIYIYVYIYICVYIYTHIYAYMHCLHCHFRCTRKLGPQIYFCSGPRGSLKPALSVRFKSWSDIFFVDIPPQRL